MSKQQTVLITGATGGLGVQLCREFAAHGWELVITARRPQELERLAGRLRQQYGVTVKSFALDLNQEEGAALLYRKLREAGLTVDVLVNNAGFGLGARFAQSPLRRLDAMMRVNMLAPTRLSRLLLPGMLARGRGGILNIASTGSYVAGPYNAVYCASKAYLLSLSEALAFETRHSPVRVCAVCPGATYTGFARRANMEQTWLFNLAVLEPPQVAQQAYRAFVRGRSNTIVGAANRAMIFSARLVPRFVSTGVSALLQKPGQAG